MLRAVRPTVIKVIPVMLNVILINVVDMLNVIVTNICNAECHYT